MFHKATNTTNKKNKTALSGFSKITIGIFLLGFIPGCICAHFFEDYLYGTVISLFENTVNQIPWLSIDRNEIFLLSFREHTTYLLLLVFFALTNVWRLYYIGSTIYVGFSQGLFFSFCTMTYGIGGVLQYFCFLLPQGALLVPVFLFAINRLENLHRDWFCSDTQEYRRTLSFFTPQKKQLIFHQLPFFFLCIILLLLCAVLEGYLNVPLIKAYNSGLK